MSRMSHEHPEDYAEILDAYVDTADWIRKYGREMRPQLVVDVPGSNPGYVGAAYGPAGGRSGVGFPQAHDLGQDDDE